MHHLLTHLCPSGLLYLVWYSASSLWQPCYWFFQESGNIEGKIFIKGDTERAFSCFLMTWKNKEMIFPYLKWIPYIKNWKSGQFSKYHLCFCFWTLFGVQSPLLNYYYFCCHLSFFSTPCECFISAAAAKLLQSCPTLCDPIEGSPPGSPVPGILQARVLEWVAISFSNAGKWKMKVKSLSRVRLLATPWTVAYQAPLSMGFSRQEYWSGVPVHPSK